MKRLLVILAALLLAASALSACGNAGAESEEEISCDDVAEQISSVEEELDDAKSDAKESEGTPDESKADDRVDQLEDELKGLRACEDDSSTTTTSTTVPEEDEVPEEYKLVFYQFVPGVPQNYFGPACKPDGDPEKCKKDLSERVQHDPMLLSIQLRNFKLLPGWDASMKPEQVEKLRKKWADKLEADWTLREEWSTKVQGVLGSLQNLRVEALDGPYYTEYVTPDGATHQAQKEMDPAVNNALVGEDVEGNVHHVKLDCGHQTVSPNPIPGTPMGPLPPQDQPTTETGGKDHRKSPVSSDRNDPDERVRPNIDPPDEVIRPDVTSTTQPAPPVTIPDPPEVLDPEPIAPGVGDLPPTDVDPAEEPGADTDGDGIPDD